MPPRLRFLLIVAAAALTGTSALAAEAGLCRIRIDVMGNFGDLVDASELSMTVGGSSIPVEQNKMIPSPCGHYRLTVTVRGFAREVQEGEIEQVEQVITVAMRLGMMEDVPVPDCAIFARITGQAEVRRVRLMQLFGRYLVDVPAIAAKTVDFRHLVCGDYMLIAMGATGCLGTQVVRTTPAATRVDLAVKDHAANGCSNLAK